MLPGFPTSMAGPPNVQSGTRTVRVGKLIWDSVMLAAAFAQAGASLGQLAAGGNPPVPPFAALAGGGMGAGGVANAQLVEALRKLIASGAIDAAVVAGISRTVEYRPKPDAVPAPGLPTSLEMASGPKLPTVEKVNGRYPINSQYAGGVYPVDKLPPPLRLKYPRSVRFDAKGFPDFKPYAIREVKVNNLTGHAKSDYVKANRAAGIDSVPYGYVWHHHQDCQTMQLVPRDLHETVLHTGGSAILAGRAQP